MKNTIQEMQMCLICSPGFNRNTVLAHNINAHVFVFEDGFVGVDGTKHEFLNECVGTKEYVLKLRSDGKLKENICAPATDVVSII